MVTSPGTGLGKKAPRFNPLLALGPDNHPETRKDEPDYDPDHKPDPERKGAGERAADRARKIGAGARDAALSSAAHLGRAVSRGGHALSQPLRLFTTDAGDLVADVAERRRTGAEPHPEGNVATRWLQATGRRLEHTGKLFRTKQTQAELDARPASRVKKERQDKGLLAHIAGSTALTLGGAVVATLTNSSSEPDQPTTPISSTTRNRVADKNDLPRPREAGLSALGVVDPGPMEVEKPQVKKPAQPAEAAVPGVPTEMIVNGDVCTLRIPASQLRTCINGFYKLPDNLYFANGKLTDFVEFEEDAAAPDGIKWFDFPKDGQRIMEKGVCKFARVDIEMAPDETIIGDITKKSGGITLTAFEKDPVRNALAERERTGIAGFVYRLEKLQEAIDSTSTVDAKGVRTCDENELRRAAGEAMDKSFGIVSEMGAPMDPYNYGGGGFFQGDRLVRNTLSQETRRTAAQLADFEARMSAKAEEVSWVLHVDDPNKPRPIPMAPTIRLGENPIVDATVEVIGEMLHFTQQLHSDGISSLESASRSR